MLYLLKQLSFSKILFTFLSITSRSFKITYLFAVAWNLYFAVNLVTSFSRQKTLKSKNKKPRIFWTTKFYHPAKFELKRRKIRKIESMKTIDNSKYYSFKIFLRFWLAKIRRIIYHNKLLSIQFGRTFPYWTGDVKSAGKVAVYWTVNRENLGTRLSCFRSE